MPFFMTAPPVTAMTSRDCSGANCSKYLAVRPTDRETQTRNHLQFNIGVRFPLVVLAHLPFLHSIA
jgi:hypothetical protein